MSDQSRTIPAADLPTLLKSAGGQVQRAALEDGIVTADEYRAAWVATHRCVVEAAAGLPGVVIDPVSGSVGAMSFGWSAPTKDLGEALSALQSRCLDEHARSVISGWGRSAAYERIARVTAAVAACMRKEGAVVPDNADWQGLLAASQAAVGGPSLYDRCSAQVPPE